MNNEIVGKILLRIPEVVQATGYSRAFIYEKIAAGELPVVRNGRTIRVATDDLLSWVNDLKVDGKRG